jgi:hypothetical protein
MSNYALVKTPEKSQDSIQTYMEKWIAVENQLTILQEKTKTMREWKKKLSDKIAEYMQEKNMSSKKLDHGEWKLQERTEYSTLSFAYVEDCLRELIPEEDQVDFVMDYLRDHREATKKIEVKYKKKNTDNT